MYIHRIVIDANRINTRKDSAAMNRLEALHDANIVEILRTTTLAAEFSTWKPGQEKAKKFSEIGGGQVHLTGSRIPDSRWGSGLETRFLELNELIFGPGYPPDEKRRTRNLRDALHVDQACLHEADFFVTDDQAILASNDKLMSAGFMIRICTAEECLELIDDYHSAHYKTTDIASLSSMLGDLGPILLGSNSIDSFGIIGKNGETLLSITVANGLAALSAAIRTSSGKLSLSIEPKVPPTFFDNDSALFGNFGPSPLLVGDKAFRDFGVTVRGAQVLSARILKCNRIMIVSASMFDDSGQVAVQISRDRLELNGAGLRRITAPSELIGR
jgi:hypothetical protein